MAVPYKYVHEAVERIAQAYREMTIPADPPFLKNDYRVARTVQTYLFPLPDILPCVVMYPAGLTVTSDGEPYESQVVTATVRHLIGKTQGNQTGENQRLLWLVQPFIVNWFNSHRDLCWKDDQTQIDALRPAGSSINNIGRVGVFRDDELHVGYEVTHTLEFHIDNEDDFYYGD